MGIQHPSETEILEAAAALKRGELVAFPTETVYGLGADASNNVALERLYQAKGRPESHPVIVHIASVADLKDWAVDIPEEAFQLASRFWPGPMTLILKKAAHISERITGGQATIGVRIPSHQVALDLLERFGGGIAAPSANKFGKISPTTAADVRKEFGDEVAHVLDGGSCQVGIESTIIDLTGGGPRILRPGMITKREIFDVIGAEVIVAPGVPKAGETRAPGSMKSHYAPRTPLRLLPFEQLVEEIERADKDGEAVAVLAFRARPVGAAEGEAGWPKALGAGDRVTDEKAGAASKSAIVWVTAPSDPPGYAHQLYSSLRKLDKAGANFILVETPPASENWLGIMDRLRRAAHT